MNDLQKYEVTLKSNIGDVFSMVLSPESTVEDLLDGFFGLMVGSGYQMGSIEDYIKETADYLNQRDEPRG